jgi:hypothetical protein
MNTVKRPTSTFSIRELEARSSRSASSSDSRERVASWMYANDVAASKARRWGA